MTAAPTSSSTSAPAADDSADSSADAPDRDVVAREEQEELIRTVARQALGFEELRPGQLEAASAVLDGRDVLAVMPTGSGKSGVYQLAGALVSGPVVVVSPLLALQRDQVAKLAGRLGGGAVLNGDLSASDHAGVLQSVEDGDVRFVLMAPEQLLREDVRAALARAAVELMVVDEAHCIAGWGHDFRPAFLQLGECRAALGDPRALALTATASAPVRREITAELRMDDPVVITAGVVRPEIALSVVDVRDIATAEERVVQLVGERDGTGLVYAATRASCEDLAARLSTPERPAVAYHAGLPPAERGEIETRFGEPDPIVVVATTAFGMGIDVPHVRFVVHRDVPASLDDYYQELGRAGRDGLDAEAILVRQLEQATARRMEGGTTTVPPALIDRIARGLAGAGEEVSLEDVASDVDVTDTLLLSAVELLSRAGAVETDVEGERIRWVDGTQVDDAVEEAVAAHERAHVLARTQTQMMARYLDEPDCRWRVVGTYFGERVEQACGRCDRCESGAVAESDGMDGDGPPVGARVRHTEFGDGVIEGASGRTMTVLFDDAGYRTLLATTIEDGLVEVLDEDPAAG